MHKKIIMIAVPVLGVILTVSCASAPKVNPHYTPSDSPIHWHWSEVQRSGGIRFGQPGVHRGKDFGCTLPVHFTEPLIPNRFSDQGGWVSKVRKKINGNTICIWIVSEYLSRERLARALCIRSVMLSHIQPGIYHLQYLDPDGTTVDLEQIELKED